MKRKISLIFILVLLVSIISIGIFGVTARAASHVSTNYFWNDGVYYMSKSWDYSNIGWGIVNELYIIDCEESKSGDVIIDYTDLSEIYVKGISSKAFYNCDNLSSITIPKCVDSISDNAFLDCDNLIIYCEDASKPSGWGSNWNSSNCPVVWDCYNNNVATDGYVYTTIDNLRYKVKDGIATIIMQSKNLSGEIVIPSFVTYKGTVYSVTSIGASAFSGLKTITSITLPDSITNIGDSAFYNCSNLGNVTMGDNVTSIGNSAFYGCSSLENIVIPDSITSIGETAFSGCNNLKYLEYNNGKYFGKSGNPHLILVDVVDTSVSSFQILSTTKIIYNDALSGCQMLTSIAIPDSITNIGNSAFFQCDGLTSVYVSDLTAWCNIVFGNSYANPLTYAKSLCLNDEIVTELVIPNDVTTIGNYAFSNLSSLSNITVPTSVKSIGSYAFSGCSGLKSLEIPNSVTIIGDSALSGCSSLESIILPFVGGDKATTSANSSTLFGYIFGKSSYTGGTSTAQYYSSSCFSTYYIPTSLKSVTVTGGYIGYGAFYNCSTLTCVTIGDGVTNIGGSAFSGCASLESITLPFVGGSKTATDVINSTVFGYIFGDSSYTGGIATSQYPISGNPYHYKVYYIPASLYSVTISGGSIPYHAFQNCKSLNSITIGPDVTSIGDSAFVSCVKLVEVINKSSISIKKGTSSNGYIAYYAKEVHSGTTKVVNQNDYLFYTYNDVNYLIGYTRTSTKITLPDTYNGQSYEILRYAFSGYNVTNVTIPDNVTSIGDYTFQNCSTLTNVTIGNEVTRIGQYAFSDCSSLKSIIIPDNVASIGDYAFFNCSNLSSVVIGDGVTIIGGYTFYNCSTLANVTLGNSVTNIANYAFYRCSKLASIVIPDSITEIGSSAFSDCSNLKYTEYNNAKYLGNSDNLHVVLIDVIDISTTSFTIPSTTKIIYSNAFSACNKLTSIVIPEGVINIGWHAFYKCSALENITIPSSVTSIACAAFEDCDNLSIYGRANIYAETYATMYSIPYIYLHEYDSDCDEICNFCGYTRTASHYFEWIIDKENNCGVNGIKHEECTICNHKRSTNTDIPATGEHNLITLNDKNCSVCGLEVILIQYDYNNGAGIKQIWLKPNDSTIIPSEAPSQSGYNFVGWSTSKNGDIEYQAGATLSCLSKSITLYAQWDKRCTICSGYGMIIKSCSYCHGSGYYTDDCANCDGEGGWYVFTKTCSKCNGSGCQCSSCGRGTALTGKCSYCGSNSVRTCTSCAGTGGTKEWKYCTSCSATGTKTYKCYSCPSSYTCTSCKGTGKVTRTSVASPNAPEMNNYDENTVILKEITNGEYSMDGIHWQDSPVFDNLETDIEYHFYQRYAKTDTTYASGASEVLKITICSHSQSETKTENEVGATCSIDGSRDTVIYCSACGDEISRETKKIDKLGHEHSTEWTVDVEPTCTTAGSKSRHCLRCDDKADVTVIPENGHSYGEWVSVNSKQHQHTCFCGYSEFKDHEFDAEGVCTSCKKKQLMYGDVNGDGRIDATDVIMLRKYIANYNYETDTSTVAVAVGADVNVSGKIDASDVIMLRKYMANYDYTTGSSSVVLGPKS